MSLTRFGSVSANESIVSRVSLLGTGNTAGNTTVTGGDIYFQGGNNMTISMTSNTVVFSAGAGGGLSNINVSAGTTSNNLSNLVFSNSNGVSFGLNGSTITASVNPGGGGLTNINVSAGTTSNNLSNLVFTNSNNVSFGLNGSTISASASFNQTVQPGIQSIQVSNTTYTTGNVIFSNANGLTFGSSAGGAITASHNGITSQSNQQLSLYGVSNTTQGSSGTANASNLSFQGAGVASVGISNGSVVISVPSGGGGLTNINVSAGTTSNNLSNLVFSNSNGVTFGLNGSTVTASVNAGGGQTVSTYIPYYPASTGAQTLGAQGVTSASAWFFPLSIQNDIVFNRVEQLMTASVVSSNASFNHTVTHQFGLFSNNAGTLSLISSSSYSVGITGSSVSHTLSAPAAYGTGGGYTYSTFTATATNAAQSLFGTAGNRIMTHGYGNTISLSPGLYWLGIHQRQSSVGANGGMAFALGGNVMAAAQNAGGLGSSTAAYTGTNNTLYKVPWGVATSTGSAGYGGSQLPSAVNVTAMGMTVTQIPMMTFISR